MDHLKTTVVARGDGNLKVDPPPSAFLTHRAPGSSPKRPEGQSAISYDYSEEELMASIEREYCR